MSFETLAIQRRIQQAMAGESVIARSWQRSLERYRIDPGQATPPRVYSHERLKDYQSPLEELMHTARGGMRQLALQTRDAGYVVLLTDAQGITVDFVNNSSHDKELRHAGLYLGSCWSEDVEGTCAVGVCTVEKTPITIHHDEHFRSPNTTLTCSSAPIFGPHGDLLAVLDASALYSPQEKRSQHLVMQMVIQTSRLVENAYFLNQNHRHHILHLSETRELLDVQISMLMALNDEGCIVAANSQARHFFSAFFNSEDAPTIGIPHKKIDQLLGISLENLLAQSSLARGSVQLAHMAQGCRLHALVRSPQRRLAAASNQKEVRDPPAQNLQPLHALAGSDPRMMSNVLNASRVMNKGISVLLHGETGTGKEVFAQAMHMCSARHMKPFIALNCAAIPESLIESELFGYVDGAFTGARSKGTKGKIQQADGGTLFLDEIGDMPLALQTRLLRVLAEGEVMPLGAEEKSKVDLQIICASHRDLPELIAQGLFRQDLYYRLSGIVIELPALRERQNIDALIEHILAEQSRQQSRVFIPKIAEDALYLLRHYSWPGNIRELKNVLRTALALCDNNCIEARHLPREIQTSNAHPGLVPVQIASLGATELVVRQTNTLATTFVSHSSLLTLLRKERWNISEVARQLDVCRSTIYRRMQREGIQPYT